MRFGSAEAVQWLKSTYREIQGGRRPQIFNLHIAITQPRIVRSRAIRGWVTALETVRRHGFDWKWILTIRRHLTFHQRIKFQHNRIKRGWVNDDLGNFLARFSGSQWVNSSHRGVDRTTLNLSRTQIHYKCSSIFKFPICFSVSKPKHFKCIWGRISKPNLGLLTLCKN